jgi:hypothetical protein
MGRTSTLTYEDLVVYIHVNGRKEKFTLSTQMPESYKKLVKLYGKTTVARGYASLYLEGGRNKVLAYRGLCGLYGNTLRHNLVKTQAYYGYDEYAKSFENVELANGAILKGMLNELIRTYNSTDVAKRICHNFPIKHGSRQAALQLAKQSYKNLTNYFNEIFIRTKKAGMDVQTDSVEELWAYTNMYAYTHRKCEDSVPKSACISLKSYYKMKNIFVTNNPDPDKKMSDKEFKEFMDSLPDDVFKQGAYLFMYFAKKDDDILKHEDIVNYFNERYAVSLENIVEVFKYRLAKYVNANVENVTITGYDHNHVVAA